MTLSLVALTDAEYDDWAAAFEERLESLIVAGSPGGQTRTGAAALREALPDGLHTAGAEIAWVTDGQRAVGHVWWSHDGAEAMVRDVRLDDSGDAAEVLGLVRDRCAAAGAEAISAWWVAGDPSHEAFHAAGLTTTSTNMALPFRGEPPASETVRLREMTAGEFDDWQRVDLDHYVSERVSNGETQEVARRTAEEQTVQLLPDGVDTDGHWFWFGEAEGRRVGTLWLDVRHDYAFVYGVTVEEGERGRGYGRALMQAGAHAAHRAGCTGIALNVFGDNLTARGLYDSLGYRPTQGSARMLL